MNLILRAYVTIQQRRVRRFLADADRGAELQREVLFDKIRRDGDSEFGRQHGIDKITTVEEFRRQVPIADYEYFRPYVERVKRGELRALFGPQTRVLMFAMTSGTTNASKYIPITEEFFRDYRDSWNVWGLRTYAQHPDLIRRTTLSFSSDWQQSRTDGGIYCGNISGLAADTRPAVARKVFCLPSILNKIGDPEAKQYAALRLSMASERVGMIITANPLTLIGLARLGDRERESLVRDIHDGRLSEAVAVEGSLRDRLRPHIGRGNPRRARQLAEIAERQGRLWPRDYWPHLSVLAIWTGGSVGAYLPQVREYYGDLVLRDHGLSASEGRMTTPLEPNTSNGVLNVGSHYFEFIPEREHGSENPTILEAHELERDRNYYLIMSTSSALWRHDIHDVVRCVGFRGQAPILTFLNKGAHYCSMTGEKLSEHQVVIAVRATSEKSGLRFEHFTLAPVFGDPPHYELLVEADLQDSQRQAVAAELDKQLSRANCEYENRLETGRLEPVVIRELPSGTWARFHQRVLGRRGASLEQFKHPCLTSDYAFIDGLLATSPTA